MNGYVPNGMPYQQVYMSGGFPGQRGGQSGQSLYYQQGGGGIGYGGAGVVPQQLMQLQADPLSLNKLVHQQLGALQQQFVQNYAFINSTLYHPAGYTSPRLGDKNHRRTSTNELCSDIKQEILRQLSSGCAASTSVTPEASRESSPDQALTPEQDDMSSNINARGVKRQLDLRQSPLKKRYRSEDDGDDEGPEPPVDKLASVTQVITNYFRQYKQPQDVFTRKMRLREALYTVMKGVFPYCGLYIVGSSMNGLGSSSSDMDLCLMLSASDIDQKKEATEILRVLCKALRRCTFIRDLKLIKAKVPILKFYDRISGVECDLNINNSVGIRNTHLLNAYTKLDWRVSPLILFIKHWASIQNINDAKNGTISSYSLVLMILHYLQYGCRPPVIPSLQQKYPNKFSKNLDVRLLSLNEKLPVFKSPNKDTLGELFVGFLSYYANEFNFDTDAISVRLGTKLSRGAVKQNGPPHSQWKCLCIEEPFDLSNTARSVYDEYVFERIYRVIRVSHARLRRTLNVHSILEEPL
jgi:poly(A) RNA polymerase GLD2